MQVSGAASTVSRQGGHWAREQGGGWWETSLMPMERSPQGRLDSGELGKASVTPEAQERTEQTKITSPNGKEGLKDLSELSLSGNMGDSWKRFT